MLELFARLRAENLDSCIESRHTKPKRLLCSGWTRVNTKLVATVMPYPWRPGIFRWRGRMNGYIGWGRSRSHRGRVRWQVTCVGAASFRAAGGCSIILSSFSHGILGRKEDRPRLSLTRARLPCIPRREVGHVGASCQAAAHAIRPGKAGKAGKARQMGRSAGRPACMRAAHESHLASPSSASIHVRPIAWRTRTRALLGLLRMAPRMEPHGDGSCPQRGGGSSPVQAPQGSYL